MFRETGVSIPWFMTPPQDNDIIETTAAGIKIHRGRADPTQIWQDPHKTD